MAAARLDLASVFLYAGSILPGIAKMTARRRRSRSSTPSRPSAPARAGKMSRADVDAIEQGRSVPGEGACGGMYTANTMASVAEAMGM